MDLAYLPLAAWRQKVPVSEQEPEIRILKVVLVGEDGADTSFGHYMKGIYVEEGGTLDIHGKEKLPWTRLTAARSACWGCARADTRRATGRGWAAWRGTARRAP